VEQLAVKAQIRKRKNVTPFYFKKEKTSGPGSASDLYGPISFAFFAICGFLL
jgi:hypothetical protein